MGTSRRRTRRAPVSPGPEGARTAYRGRQKTSKSPFGFKWETRNCPQRTRWKLFNSALQTIAVSLSGSTDPVAMAA
jgi:hypothetical protein